MEAVKSQSMLFHAQIHTVVIPVSDLETSRAWYTSCQLGTEVLYDGLERLALLRLGSGMHIALVETPPDATQPPVSRRPYAVLEVPDASKVRSALEAAGVTTGPLTAQGRARVFPLLDPDGNLFEISDLGAPGLRKKPAAD